MVKHCVEWLSTCGLQLARDGVIVVLIVLAAIFLHKFWKRMVHNSGYPVRCEAEQNWEIYTELVELRAIADCDRAYVFRFHNGMEFLPSHSAWKISCTHEVVKHGVTYESAKLQGILVSLIPNLIGPVLTGSSSASGIVIPECPECPFKTKCLKENKRIVVIQVSEMASSYCKFHLESKNVKTAIFCGIAKGGSVYGLVGVDFCGASLGKSHVLDIAQKVCRATEKIQFLLQSKKAPSDILT